MDNNNKKAVYSKYFPLLLCAGIIMVVTIVLYVLGANDIIKLPNKRRILYEKNFYINFDFIGDFRTYGLCVKDI